jgi:hypothetical protein
MKRTGWKAFFALVILAAAAILQGCTGGGAGTDGEYRLTVTVRDANQNPVENALVEVVGSDLDAKTTTSAGQASFSALSGLAEVLVRADGFVNKTETVRMDRNRNITVSLETRTETEVSGPRFVTVSQQGGRYFSFESGQASTQPGEEDLLLTWVQYGGEYTNIAFEGCNGVRFSGGHDLVDANPGVFLNHFRNLTEEDWEPGDPGSTIRLEEYDTLLLKTNTGRYVKVFIVDIRGHWNHEDAPAVDFAYLFLDEVDRTSPVLKSVTVVTTSGTEITQPVQGEVIEFELTEDPELVRLTLSEVAYGNRPLERDDNQPPSGFEMYQPVFFYPDTGYQGSSYFAEEFAALVSTTGSESWSEIDLVAGDEEFYAKFDNDQGFFLSDLSGNELRELPFDRIMIKWAQ